MYPVDCIVRRDRGRFLMPPRDIAMLALIIIGSALTVLLALFGLFALIVVIFL